MSELSSTAAVGIETVEWLDGGNGNLIVRVTGRWRRRRPASTAQVTLVIESEGRRHRFPAMPEPPSVGGTGPGMWRLSFSVPGWLAPALGGRTWLSLGTVTVPLPAPGALDEGRAEPQAAVEGEPAPSPVPSGPVATPPPEPPPADPGGRVTELEHLLVISRSERDVLERALTDARIQLQQAVSQARAQEDELRAALDAARSERERLDGALAEGERARRVAEQRAHAEQALRRDLARQLSVAEREADRARDAMGELAAAEERIRSLERRLREARRRGDEAEQAAAAAAARARARPAEVPEPSTAPEPAAVPEPAAAPDAARAVPVPGRDAEVARLRFERALRDRAAGALARVPAEPNAGVAAPVAAPNASPQPPPDVSAETPPDVSAETPRGLAAETMPPASPAPPEPTEGLVQTLRRELDARAAGDAALRSRLVAAETRLASRVLLEQRTNETLVQLRQELDGLRAALADERSRRQAAEGEARAIAHERRVRATAERRVWELQRELSKQRERSQEAGDAIGELRAMMQRLAQPAPDPDAEVDVAKAATPPSGAVQADRLSDALARLRESVAPPEEPAGEAITPAVTIHPAGRTLEAAFRRLVKLDPAAAGELVLDLLPLQRLAYPHPIAYDLVLGTGRGCVRVTVGEGPPSVERHGAARTREEIDFRVQGEPARIARLLVARGIWRRLGLRVARVRGRREGLVALRALLALPLDLVALRDAGATLRPESVLALGAGMADPADGSGTGMSSGPAPNLESRRR